MDQTFDPNDPSYQPPAGSDFDTLIMGRNAAQQAAQKALAINYFNTRYGIDFSSSDSAQGGNVILLHFSSDDLWQKKLYFGTGFRNDFATSDVYRGYYTMFVVGSSATFTGTWGGAGTVVANGTLAEFGEFSVDVTGKCSDGTTDTTNIHFDYQYVEPEDFDEVWVPNMSEVEITHDTLGSGTMLWRKELTEVTLGGDVHALGSAIITFP